MNKTINVYIDNWLTVCVIGTLNAQWYYLLVPVSLPSVVLSAEELSLSSSSYDSVGYCQVHDLCKGLGGRQKHSSRISSRWDDIGAGFTSPGSQQGQVWPGGCCGEGEGKLRRLPGRGVLVVHKGAGGSSPNTPRTCSIVSSHRHCATYTRWEQLILEVVVNCAFIFNYHTIPLTQIDNGKYIRSKLY